MILITFVENVFKHGVSSHKKERRILPFAQKKENYYWQQTILY